MGGESANEKGPVAMLKKIDLKMIALIVLVVLAWVGIRYITPPVDTATDVDQAVEVAPPAITPRATNHQACRSLSGPQVDRVRTCLGELRPASFPGDSREMFDDISGGLFIAGARLPVDDEQSLLDIDSDIGQALLGIDEEAAAAALRDGGFRKVVVYRDLVGAVDRDSVVLARLAHHDHLEWFQLRIVTPQTMVYTVRSSSTRLRLETGQALLEGLRARLEGRPPPLQRWKPNDPRLLASMRLQGHSLVLRHSVGPKLESVLDELAGKMRTRWERDVQINGHGSLEERLDDLRIEVHVVMERARVFGRSKAQIFDLWEMGVDGMMFRHREGVENEKFSYMPGSELMTRSIRSTDAFLQYAVKQFGWRDARPWEDTSTRLDIIRTQHFMEKHGGSSDEAIRLYRGFPEVEMDDLSDQSIQQMLVDGGDWWLQNMNEDGSVRYKYWPAQHRLSDDYNEVRHILAARDLADVWRYRNEGRYLDGAKLNMDWLLTYEVAHEDVPHPLLPHPPKDSILFRYPLVNTSTKAPNQKLGTVAVALLGWVAWAQATGDHSEDKRIREMAEFVLSRQDETGRFDPYYVHRSHSYFGQRNDIVPGEAALALGMVAEYFDEMEWLEFFPKFLDYYEPWFRTRAENTNPYGRWPHHTYDNLTRLDLVQFGPWAVMATKQYYGLTGDERAATFGLEIADWMIDSYQWRSDRTPFPDYAGGYYKLPEELPAMQTFCYSEGTAAAYEVAAKMAPDQKDYYDLSTREAIRFMEVMQYDDVDAYFSPDPLILKGGIKYAMNENKVRIDYVGHGLSTLSQYLDAREADPAVQLQIRDPRRF